MPTALKQLVARVQKKHPRLPISTVFSTLAKQYRGPGSWFAPSRVAEDTPRLKSASVLRSIQVLSDRPYEVLFTKWVVFGERVSYDPMDPDDQEEFELEAQEALDAAQTGRLQHPKTGDIVNAAGRVALYFVTNDELWSAK